MGRYDEFLEYLKKLHRSQPRERKCRELYADADIEEGMLVRYVGKSKKVRPYNGQGLLAGSADSDAKKGDTVWVTYHGSADVPIAFVNKKAKK